MGGSGSINFLWVYTGEQKAFYLLEIISTKMACLNKAWVSINSEINSHLFLCTAETRLSIFVVSKYLCAVYLHSFPPTTVCTAYFACVDSFGDEFAFCVLSMCPGWHREEGEGQGAHHRRSQVSPRT